MATEMLSHHMENQQPMRRNKGIIIAIIALIAIVTLGVGIWFVADHTEWIPTDYTENDEDDLVVYDGKKYQYNEHLSNYLFLGIDKREVTDKEKNPGTAGQADSILLVSYDRVKNTVQCISIPRDTMTFIRTFSQEGVDLGKSKDHLNIQYAFGDGKDKSCNLMKEAVEGLLYGVPVRGYCALSMDGIPAAVEAVGQVELVVPDDTLVDVNPEFKKGNTVLLTKENTEQFVRYRDIEIRQSAIDRGNRQKVFVKAFVETAREKATQDEGLVTTIYEKLRPYMVTNIGNDIFVKLLQAKNESGEMFVDIPGETVNGTDFDEYHVNSDELYELVLQMFYKEVQED